MSNKTRYIEKLCEAFLDERKGVPDSDFKVSFVREVLDLNSNDIRVIARILVNSPTQGGDG